MRLELTPLDIRTVTLITGIIESNLHVNEVEHHLPANSYYKVTEDWLNERKKGTNRPPGMAAADYAKQFVDKVERGASGKTNIGHIMPMFVYVKWWLPQFLWVSHHSVDDMVDLADLLGRTSSCTRPVHRI